MKQKIIYFILIFGTLSISCDDFLTKYPHDSVPYDYVFKTQEDFEVALRGMYSSFKSSAYYGKNFIVYPDVMTDEAAAILGFSNDLGIMYHWDHSANEADVEGMWAAMYSAISRANTILDNIESITKENITDSVRLQNIKGEALVARALAHFDLIRLFAKPYHPITSASDAGVPYLTSFSLSSPARSSVKLVYDQIIADLKTSLNTFNNQTFNSFYLSPAAANALLARVYLYMKDYNNAIIYAQKVIDNDQFKLLQGADFTSMWSKDEGEEIIWRIGLTTNDVAGKTPGANYYNDAQGKPNPDYMPTNEFLSIYDTTDIRYTTYFTTEDTRYGWPLTMVKKYPTNPLFTTTSNANGANMPKVFRLSEMYLILAEAYDANESSGQAWSYIQFLRANRLKNYKPENDRIPSNITEEIFTERKRELAFEGHLFFDYKRLGKGFIRQGRSDSKNNLHASDTEDFEVQADNFRWLLPIPQAEINANNNITANDQNPGY